jgi:hypothetical protein
LWASKVSGIPILGISRLPLGSPRTKWHLGASSMARHKEYYKGKVVASPKFVSWWVLWVCVCPWLVRALKLLQLCINKLVVWFVQSMWGIELLVIFPNPHLGTPACPSTPKCYKPRNVPQLLILPLFSHLDSQWIYQGVRRCVIYAFFCWFHVQN